MNPGHLLLSESGVIRSMNAVAASLLGVESSAWTGRRLTELCAESRWELIAEAWAFLRATGTEDGQDLTGVVRPGDESDDWPPLGWRISALAGEEGFLLLLWKVSADHEALASYRDTFTHAVEGIYRTTLEGRYLEANPALARMYGYESPAALIDALSDLNTQLYVQQDRRAEFVFQIWQQGFVSDFESEIYRADGSKIWISEFARTVQDAGGRPIYFEGSVIDITENRRVLTTLAASRERYRHLVESLDLVPWEGILENRRFTYVGPQAEALLGWPAEDWLREGFWAEHVYPDDLGWVQVVQEETLSRRALSRVLLLPTL